MVNTLPGLLMGLVVTSCSSTKSKLVENSCVDCTHAWKFCRNVNSFIEFVKVIKVSIWVDDLLLHH
jgi:hypothetical protein